MITRKQWRRFVLKLRLLKANNIPIIFYGQRIIEIDCRNRIHTSSVGENPRCWYYSGIRSFKKLRCLYENVYFDKLLTLRDLEMWGKL